jgi:hypothetical protein
MGSTPNPRFLKPEITPTKLAKGDTHIPLNALVQRASVTGKFNQKRRKMVGKK